MEGGGSCGQRQAEACPGLGVERVPGLVVHSRAALRGCVCTVPYVYVPRLVFRGNKPRLNRTLSLDVSNKRTNITITTH